MDKKEYQEQFTSSEIDQENMTLDYQLLVHKLKNIKKSIALLEKNFLDKKI